MELSNGATISKFIAKKIPTYNATKANTEVALGDLQPEEMRDVQMEIQLPVCSDLTRYAELRPCDSLILNLVTAVMETVTADLFISRTDTGKPKTSNPLIDKQKNRIMTVKVLQDAKKKANEGKYEEGRQLLLEQKQTVALSATCLSQC